MLIMLPMLPGILSILYPLGNQPWMIPIPILGQHVLLADVLGGKSPHLIGSGSRDCRRWWQGWFASIGPRGCSTKRRSSLQVTRVGRAS